jgi:hypothetical protein
MTPDERFAEIYDRAHELEVQLTDRARLFRLMGLPAIADELDRMRSAELAPILQLARPVDLVHR